MNKKFLGYGLLLAALTVAPFFGAYPIFVMKLLCFALFASAFNLLLGYTGLLSFGHAAFFGGSAYVAGHAMKVWGFTPEMGLLVGTLTGAVLGWVFGASAQVGTQARSFDHKPSRETHHQRGRHHPDTVFGQHHEAEVEGPFQLLRCVITQA